MKRLLLVILLMLLWLPAQAAPQVAELSRDGIAAIDRFLGGAVREGKIPAVEAIVVGRHGVLYHEAFGTRNAAKGQALQKRDLFDVASMTKPVTAVAAMILHDDGELGLDDPVSMYLPGFERLVYEGLRRSEDRPPVIDVHMHAPMSPGPVEGSLPELYETLDVMDSLNVRFAVLTGVPDVLFAWNDEIGDRVGVLPSLLFPCENGVAVRWGRPCFEDGEDWPDLDRLRDHIEQGRVQGLGEITTQFLGLGPSDLALEPYFALAEEYDLPVFIHMLPGAPGAPRDSSGPPFHHPNYRTALGNPFLLEDALLKHPDVRVAVVHSGWPLVDEMISMLYHHPHVYAEVGLLQRTELFPRAEYYAFLRRLVRAGFADRILFGSDGRLDEGVAAILEADFLTEQQQRDILCGNAARFLRLDEATCR